MAIFSDDRHVSHSHNGTLATTNGSGTTGTSMVRSTDEEDTYDTIIVGGGAAGIGAAIGAKQAMPGSRVLIVESEACLGGAATHRGVLSYCGLYSVEKEPRRAVGRIWTELHSLLVKERAASELPDRIVAYVQVCLVSFTQ
jgi:glycine/D-amino acid oxidase-like deaminating enzyme